MYRGSLLKALELGSCSMGRRVPADRERCLTTWGTSGRPRSGFRPGALKKAVLRTRCRREWVQCEMGLMGRETGRGGSL
eukprot:gene8422-10797_t